MAFYGYKGDVGECYLTPYSNISSYDYHVISPQDSVTYTSFNEFDQPKLIEHNPYNYFDSSATQQVPSYLVYNYTQQKLLQYEPPPPYSSALFYSKASNSVSDSTFEFAEQIFEEYDLTPYGGGYDIAQTYGKPLPPSDKICYPRSTAQLPHESIPSGNGHGDDNHAVKPPKDKDCESADNQEKQNHSDNGDKVKNGTGDLDLQKPILEIKVSDVDEHPPSSDYNNGYGYDWNRQVPHTPYGSGLEAMDICESIFGYWPCIAKMNRQRNANCVVCNEERSQNEPWKEAADYLFGSPFAYGEQNNGDKGYHFYNNENYYQHQPQYP